ncbi:MAG TPA: glycosyltransferase family 4 protein [Gammaproteobacteria bacterium]|nr:glycosyltransferase family 4 protein [Gammaproteobacteria bacterium]
MKVLMVTTSYPRFCGDSAAVFLQYLARAIGSAGHDVHVLAPNDPLADGSVADERVSIHRFEYSSVRRHRLTYGSGILPNLRASRRVYLQLPFFLTSLFVSLFILARRVRPDVIHAHWIIPTGFIAVLVGRLLGIPVITTVHGGDAFSLRSSVLRWLKKFTLNNSSIWTSNTHSTADAAMSGSDISTPMVIPMGVDVQLFSSGDRALQRSGLKEREQVVLFVGRLVEKKGCNVLIEAFGHLVRDYPGNVVLWIVGDGDERDALEALVSNMGLSQSVRFFGVQSNGYLPDIYAGSDLFVLPSIEDRKGDTEGQGVVLLEAMAGGVPIIASQVGGVEEVIEDNVSGWLIESSAPELLADRIRVCLRSPDLRAAVAERARSHVMSYDWPVVAHHFVELYKAVPG